VLAGPCFVDKQKKEEEEEDSKEEGFGFSPFSSLSLSL